MNIDAAARRLGRLSEWGVNHPAWDWMVAAVSLGLLAIITTVPLDERAQGLFGLCTVAAFVLCNRLPGRGITLFLVVLSCAVSLRYIFWRITETLSYDTLLQGFFGTGLVLAELYAVTVMVLGYFQSAWTLDRKPMPLPADPADWPTVDVYIPTYNESLSVVRATVLAALAMDYPRGKMQVYILDDGRRAEFRDFAAACGAGYIIRPDNNHAKAGNLNHALAHTDGEYIAIFDCDHIPTRAFLQMTLGTMVAAPSLAMLQTPHHFYSPDPFQRNLEVGTKVPAEGNLFYGMIQKGNDFWNAAFFCGSCAVLRRKALEAIGGIATQTVTEDAHTALRLQRHGWSTAFLAVPLAAGLSPEFLSRYIGQRQRWARGMIQILRVDNPLFGRGLRLPQRLCYFNAMLHFFYALPRLVFLSSPLAFLMLGQNIIAASPLAIFAYGLPHLILVVAANSRVSGAVRHSFWGEIYETVLAPFLLRLSFLTLIDPKRGKFNVTDKGSTLQAGYFDLRAVYPNIILAMLLTIGWWMGMWGLVSGHHDRLVNQALALNLIWCTLSLLIVLASLAVGHETQQIRAHARVRVVLPATIYLEDGRVLVGTTSDMSLGGVGVEAIRPEDVADGAGLMIELDAGNGPVLLPGHVERWRPGFLHASFAPRTLADESNIVQAIFGRPDAWVDWNDYPRDRVWRSLWTVLVSIKGLFRTSDRPFAAPPRRAPFAPVPTGSGLLNRQTLVLRPRVTAVAIGLALLGAGAAPAQAQVQAQAQTQVQTLRVPPAAVSVRPIPGQRASDVVETPASSAPTPQTSAPQTSAPQTSAPQTSAPQTSAPQISGPASPPLATQGAGPGPLPPPPVLPPAPATPVTALSAPDQAVPAQAGQGAAGQGPAEQQLDTAPAADTYLENGMRRRVLTLRQLGARGPMTMSEVSGLQGVLFGVRADEVVTGAELTLNGSMSPALLPELSNITVTLNEQYVGTVTPERDHPAFGPLHMPVNPVFFQDYNRLNFHFTGRYSNACTDPFSGLLWATVADNSTLTLTLARLPAQRDLAKLPLPFFDPRATQLTVLPFVLPANPGNATLQAAAIVSSWFGRSVGLRGARYPVSDTIPERGNAVMVLAGQNRPAGLSLPPFAGPTVAIVPSPFDPLSSVLVVGGRTDAEVLAAASALAVGSRLLSGASATVQMPQLPARQPYDAPAWVPTDRPVRFGELVDIADLSANGFDPGPVRVPFNTAPDLYTWRRRPLVTEVRFRAPAGPVVDVRDSRLDVLINDQYVRSIALREPDGLLTRLGDNIGVDFRVQDRTADIPLYTVFGRNELQLDFDLRPFNRGDCAGVPGDLHTAIDPESTIDLRRAWHFTEMPNLAFLANAGYPFTRMADLSETAIVVPAQMGALETSALLDLTSYIGALTGYPVLKLAVVRPGEVETVADRDLILLGTLAHLPEAGALLSSGPVRFDGDRITVAMPAALATIRRFFADRHDDDRARLAAQVSAPLSGDTALLASAESPYRAHRTVVAFLGASPQGLAEMVEKLREPSVAPSVRGDFSIYSGRRFTSYRVGPAYTVGSLPFWMWPDWLLRDHPLSMILLLVAACFLLALVIYGTLRRHAATRLVKREGPK